MLRKFVFRVLVLASVFAAPAAHAQSETQSASGPVGIWLTQAGDAKVNITECDSGLCGVIVWLRQPIDPATGKPAIDDKNLNHTLDQRPMIGLPLFSGMSQRGPNTWSGPIYNPDDGRNYASHISVGGPNTLKVEGCVGPLCRDETWTRSQ